MRALLQANEIPSNFHYYDFSDFQQSVTYEGQVYFARNFRLVFVFITHYSSQNRKFEAKNFPFLSCRRITCIQMVCLVLVGAKILVEIVAQKRQRETFNIFYLVLHMLQLTNIQHQQANMNTKKKINEERKRRQHQRQEKQKLHLGNICFFMHKKVLGFFRANFSRNHPQISRTLFLWLVTQVERTN